MTFAIRQDRHRHMNKACFFANVADPKLLDLMEWYRQDIQIIRQLGFELVTATQIHEIPWDSDFYFSWWFSGSLLPLVVSKIRRKPLIILGSGSEVVTSVPEIGYKRMSFAKRMSVQICLRYADALFSGSHSVAQEAKFLVPTKEFPVIPLSLDVDYYSPQPEIERQNGSIVTVAHLNMPNIKRKGLLTIVNCIPQVLEEFPNQQFVLAGTHHDAYDILHNRIVTLGIQDNISLPGRITNSAKLSLLREAAIYLQPTRHEAFGMAIAEAMSCGCPIVTSRVGSVSEVTGDICSYADVDDPASVAQQIVKLLRDPACRRNRSIEGRKWIVRHFTQATRRDAIAEYLKNNFQYEHPQD